MKELVWRWLFFVGGITMMSFGISLTIKGQAMGIGPWDVLHVGLYNHFGLSIGTWAILTGVIIVLLTMIGTKRLPQLGTILNILFIGSLIDLFNWLLPDPVSFIVQLVWFLLGVIIMSVGVGVYVSPKVGAGPRDALMLIIVDKTGWSIKRVRTGLELVVALIGWALGGPIGLGTILIALLLGQIVHYTLPWSQRLLKKTCEYNLSFQWGADNQG